MVTMNLYVHASLSTSVIKFSDGFLFLTNCHSRLFPGWYFHKWKIILHCLNGTKESYYFPSDSIELTFRFTFKRVNKNRTAANSNWKMLLLYLATMCHLICCILWMIKHNSLHQKVNLKPISRFPTTWVLFKRIFYWLWNKKKWWERVNNNKKNEHMFEDGLSIFMWKELVT